MAPQPTNAGRDSVEVNNRLDVVVLAVRADRRELATTMTPAEARQLADMLRFAADAGEQTPGS